MEITRDLLGNKLINPISVWEDVSRWILYKADLTHPMLSLARHGEVFRQVNLVFKELNREYPEWVRPLVAMTMPCIEPMGKCSLLPDGLAPVGTLVLSKLTAESLDVLFVSMERSRAQQFIGTPN